MTAHDLFAAALAKNARRMRPPTDDEQAGWCETCGNHRGHVCPSCEDEYFRANREAQQGGTAMNTPRRTRLYIAGPMTGLPDLNFPAFEAAEARLRECGYEVRSPIANGNDPKKSWEWYMRAALRQLLDCDAVALLDGAQNSRGARLERQVAEALSMEALPLDEWLQHTDYGEVS